MAQTNIRLRDVLRTATGHPLWLIGPVVLLTLVALVYARVRPATWEAAQALVVRDEAGDRLSRPGKFTHSDEMKTSQETVLELAKNRSVLRRALAEVGPPKDHPLSIAWPSEKDLEALQCNVKVTPPKGAEFGKTEVFYLKVQAESQPRAVALALAVCRQLKAQLGELREAKARSTTEELNQTVRLAQQELASATRALGEMEQRVGTDLAELRILNESPSGDSDLRRTATELEKELRTFYATQSENDEFHKLLNAAQVDPARLLASTSVLLKSQPALGRLKDGLVDAQLRTGQLLGTMSESHPLVQSGRAAERAIRQQLHDELSVAIKGVELDLRVNADRIRGLEEQNRAIQDRLGRLATVRAEYANLVTATKHRSESLKSVEHELSEARASQTAARTASLLNLVDTPDAGTRPVGPGRSAIVLAGFGSGLLIALAIVLLNVPQTRPGGEARGSLPLPQSHVGEWATGLNLRQALQQIAGHSL
jgi:succinoglycan biosynthesis transport protein ExoP